MRTVFVVNPCAGQGKKTKTLIGKIKSLKGFDVEIYITKNRGDALYYVKSYCTVNPKTRFISCGGDGTLNEVLNGVIGFDDAQVGLIPIGTGNDFCRNFDDDCNFGDVVEQIIGDTIRCDAIRYKINAEDGVVTGYCANMFNIGFDCNVADLKSKIENKPFVFGKMSYLISIFVMLATKRGANLKIEVDGKEKHRGKLLLSSIANGCYCGGGIKSNPLAEINDGYININIIKNVSRLKFISLLPYYMKGRHLGIKDIGKIITTLKCSRVKITPLDDKMKLCIDGEITDAGETEFEVCHNAFNFVLPKRICKVTENTEKIK